MSETLLTAIISETPNLSDTGWLTKLQKVAYKLGFFETLGPDHSAIYVEGSRDLLVTFETIIKARSRSEADMPIGWELAGPQGWSQLCLMSHSATWFRHADVYEFFDRLIDTGFFDDYDRIVFYGAGCCGYAAAAFSVAAPGATVIALHPQATLDPRVTEWDGRFTSMRRTDFQSRFGYGPDMVEAADRAFILYDPEEREDAMHAALFTRPNVTKLRCRHLDAGIEAFLTGNGHMADLIGKAMDGTLSALDFHRYYRSRRTHLPYLRHLLAAVDDKSRPFLTALLCRSVSRELTPPRFIQRLEVARAELARQGRVLPDRRVAQRQSA